MVGIGAKRARTLQVMVESSSTLRAATSRWTIRMEAMYCNPWSVWAQYVSRSAVLIAAGDAAAASASSVRALCAESQEQERGDVARRRTHPNRGHHVSVVEQRAQGDLPQQRVAGVGAPG